MSQSNGYVLLSTTGKPDVRGLSNSLVDVSDWHQLGIKLGIPSSELNRIEKDYQGNDRQKTETFISWLKRTPRASWSDVVSALRQMGENTVAESVRQHYIASKLMYTFLCTACSQVPAPYFPSDQIGSRLANKGE